MTKKVFKYPFNIKDFFSIELPVGAEILTAQSQSDEDGYETACIWALVDPYTSKEVRHFRLAGTGHPIDNIEDLKYVGTFQQAGGRLIWHLFERVK